MDFSPHSSRGGSRNTETFIPVIHAANEETDAGVEVAEEPELEGLDADHTPLWAIVLAGGIGSRFWPLSTPERPKQLLALVSEYPLIAETVQRLSPAIPPERVLILTSRDIADAIAGAIPEVPRENLLVEPRPLGTAAALAWGASEVSRRAGQDAIACAMHADLACAFPEPFLAALSAAAGLAARENALVAIGVRPTRAETSFGYLVPGIPLMPGGIPKGRPCRVRAFVEKPGELRAEDLVRAGALWHSGIVVACVRDFLDEIAAYTHELAPGLSALDGGDPEQFGKLIQSASIERGLLERSDNVVVLPAEFGWDDVGTWASLRRARDLDDAGNGARGASHFCDASANVVHSEAGTVVLYGVSKLLVVSLEGLTFVTTLERAKDLKPLLDTMPGSMRVNPGR
jgi:mannose-1-phosphate guanylyltransferase